MDKFRRVFDLFVRLTTPYDTPYPSPGTPRQKQVRYHVRRLDAQRLDFLREINRLGHFNQRDVVVIVGSLRKSGVNDVLLDLSFYPTPSAAAIGPQDQIYVGLVEREVELAGVVGKAVGRRDHPSIRDQSPSTEGFIL